METEYLTVTVRLLAAVVAGGLIGFERSFHGRAAGLRTHTLVCMSSALLVLLSIYSQELGLGGDSESVRADPMRIAQGIMTGIGFLGAGVILKSAATVRGLTTAASIWVTAAIGIVVGSGFFYGAALATVITLVTLIVLRWMEPFYPGHHFGRLTVRYSIASDFSEKELVQLVKEHGGKATNAGYRLEEEGQTLAWEMILHMRKMSSFKKLVEALKEEETIQNFDLTLTSR